MNIDREARVTAANLLDSVLTSIEEMYEARPNKTPPPTEIELDAYEWIIEDLQEVLRTLDLEQQLIQ